MTARRALLKAAAYVSIVSCGNYTVWKQEKDNRRRATKLLLSKGGETFDSMHWWLF